MLTRERYLSGIHYWAQWNLLEVPQYTLLEYFAKEDGGPFGVLYWFHKYKQPHVRVAIMQAQLGRTIRPFLIDTTKIEESVYGNK